jgi:hypothetical protein
LSLIFVTVRKLTGWEGKAKMVQVRRPAAKALLIIVAFGKKSWMVIGI